MDDAAHGVQATIIDLGLSRMDATDANGFEKVYWTPIEEEVFMGEGLLQCTEMTCIKIKQGTTNSIFTAL